EYDRVCVDVDCDSVDAFHAPGPCVDSSHRSSRGATDVIELDIFRERRRASDEVFYLSERSRTHANQRSGSKVVRNAVPLSLRTTPSSVGDSFTELKQIAVVVIDRELAHSIGERFDRVADPSLVLQPQPKTIDLTNAEVE